MSAARELQRRQARELNQQAAKMRQAMGDVPTAGAVDLNVFRGDVAKQREMAQEVLRQAGLLCSCGQRFRESSVQAIGYILGQFPVQKPVQHPSGQVMMQTVLEDGARLVMHAFCSRSCVDFLDALKNGLPLPEDAPYARPKMVAVRQVPSVYWYDDEAEEDGGS